MPIKKIKILLVDDHSFVRLAYRSILDKQDCFEVVGEASSGREAYFHAYRFKPDVTIMDITLPDVSGIEITRKMVKRDPAARVLVSSMHKELVYALRALKVGARGYITKDCAPELLTDAIQQMMKGEVFMVPEIATKLAHSRITGDDDPFSALSAREFEILHLVLAGKNTPDIAEMLDISSKTVSNQCTSLRNKLDVSSPIDLFRLAIRHGLVDP